MDRTGPEPGLGPLGVRLFKVEKGSDVKDLDQTGFLGYMTDKYKFRDKKNFEKDLIYKIPDLTIK
jgi:hypothetical protein